MSDSHGNARRLALAAAMGSAFTLAACAKQSLNVTCASGAPPAADGAAVPLGDGGMASASDAGVGAFALQPFKAPADPLGGGVIFSASGEVLALEGYAFPPANPGDPAFVDGWAVQFTRLLTTIDNITLASGPTVSPGDQSCTEPVVAKVTGPWAVDLAHSDSHYLQGKGGPGEEAVPIAALSHQNYPSGNSAAFDISGANPYAFGFDVIPATASAMNVNLDAPGLADYAQMVAEGCTVLYVGNATFKGDPTTCTCPTAASAAAPCDQSIYGPGLWPQRGDTVPFRLCFVSPTSYLNCQNPDNDPAMALAGEEHVRGIYFKSHSSVVAQLTIHTDHPFWDSVLHDSPAHFDQFAARVAGEGPPGTNVTFPPVALEMTSGVDFRAYTDALGRQLSWRYCIAPPTDVHSQFVGPMVFDAQSISLAPIGERTSRGLRDYYDFTTYNQSTQGHLNSDGLCYVSRHYPSPL
jgi:hypothetical protein